VSSQSTLNDRQEDNSSGGRPSAAAARAFGEAAEEIFPVMGGLRERVFLRRRESDSLRN